MYYKDEAKRIGHEKHNQTWHDSQITRNQIENVAIGGPDNYRKPAPINQTENRQPYTNYQSRPLPNEIPLPEIRNIQNNLLL